MIARLLGLLALVWAIGFVAFAVALPGPAGAEVTDGVVTLTGGEGRIDEALAVLRAHRAARMLVAGVDPEVRALEFAHAYHVPPALIRCCITLGYESVDTRTNAQEAARWVAAGHIHSVRLVTSDWHMRRATWEFRRALPADVALIPDAVPGAPSLETLFLEYNKLLARRASQFWRG